MPKKAAIYIRVSTGYQVNKESLPFQRKTLISYCKTILDIDEYEIFKDAGYSAKNTDRPAYQDMMKRLRAGEFSYLVVRKIDRISRNLIDFMTMYTELKDLKVIFISHHEQFDTSSAMGEAMLKIILIFAELERKMTSERVTAIMLDRAERGLWNGANIPFGYKWSENKKYPVLLESEAEIIKKIFTMYEKGSSTIQITRWLHINNVPTKRGGYWTSRTVSEIIRNPFYKGTLRYNYREAPHGKKKDKSEWILKEHNHPGIISDKQWNHVNAMMDANAQAKGIVGQSNRRKYTHIFGSLLRCKCGGGTTSNRDTPRTDGWTPTTYRCSNVNRGISVGCKMTGDVYLGPFVFNYIKNIISIQHIQIDSAADAEKVLLTGSMFKDIIGIEQSGLNQLLELLHTKQDKDFGVDDNTVDEATNDTAALYTEKNKLQRALDRLKHLYLYSDDAMSEKDFLIEKKTITDKLTLLDKKIKNQIKNNAQNNISFLSTANGFTFLKEFSDSTEIDYRQLSRHTDSELLKGFIRSVIKLIKFDGNKILEITFINNMVHKFVYK